MRSGMFCRLVVVGCLCSTPLVAGDALWTGNGPDGGKIHEMVVAPSGGKLFAATRGGFFASQDGGISWQRAEDGLIGNTQWTPELAIEPSAGARLYLTDNFDRIYFSDNAAEDWEPTAFALSNPSTNNVTDLAVAPGAPLRLLATTSSSGLQGTLNGGLSFGRLSNGLPPVSVPLFRVAFEPNNPQRILIGTDAGGGLPTDPIESIYLSEDGGATFQATYAHPGPAGPVRVQVRSFGFSDPGGARMIWALVPNPIGVSGHLLRSSDGGHNWIPVTWTGLPRSDNAARVIGHPSNPAALWLVGREGVFRSNTGGATWTPLNNGLQPIDGSQAAINDLLLHPNYPTNPRLWISTDYSGVRSSGDDGATWVPGDNGLAATNIRGLVVHPNNRNLLFAGYGEPTAPSPALYRSLTADIGSGVQWLPSNINIGAYQIRALAIDPTTALVQSNTVIYAGGRACPEALGADCFGARNGGLYRSQNNGQSWTTIDNGLPFDSNYNARNVENVRGLALDLRSCDAPPPSGPCSSGPLRTLYFTAGGRTTRATPTDPYLTAFRIGKSSDGGTSWSDVSSGLPQPINFGTATQQVVKPLPILVDPSNSQTLYIGTFVQFDASNVPTPTIINGVFKTTDGGDRWTAVNNGLPRQLGSANTALDVLALAMHPSDPRTLWAALSNPGVGVGLIFKTTSGAESAAGSAWTLSNIGLTMPDVRALLVDPSNPNVIYAAGAGTPSNPGGVFKSIDGGTTWVSISIGLPADVGLSLALDPVDRNLLHAGTNSGVYSLRQVPDSDRDGIPDAIEDLAPDGSLAPDPKAKARGDGNGDGTADKFQGDVGSTVVIYKALNVWTKLGTPAVDKGSVPYFTTDIVDPSSCTQGYDVHAPAAGAFGVDRNPHGLPRTYPQQLVRLEIPGCRNATINIIFHDADFGNGAGWSFRSFGPMVPGDDASFRWFPLGSAARLISSRVWEIKVDAGALGSYRPGTAAILFVGGPAYDDQVFASGFETPPAPN